MAPIGGSVLRILLIADIHSNLEALTAVLAAEPNVDAVWCLGDVVGYGPNPNECIALLREQKLTCIAGNHDRGALGQLDISSFNSDARAACEWTGAVLNEASREFLTSLEASAVMDRAFLAHGSPRDPILEYIFNQAVALPNFEYFVAPVCLVGHTHVPLIFTRSAGPGGSPEHLTAVPEPAAAISLQGLKAIVNPGSVGQPRDGNPDAAYMLFDSNSLTFTLGRTPYEIARTQERILTAGLPSRLAARLSYGW